MMVMSCGWRGCWLRSEASTFMFGSRTLPYVLRLCMRLCLQDSRRRNLSHSWQYVNALKRASLVCGLTQHRRQTVHRAETLAPGGVAHQEYYC